MRKIVAIVALVIVISMIGAVFFLNSVGMFSSAPFFSTDNGAIDGYDPVAFFVNGKATEGKPGLTFEYAGTTWRFVSEENRQAFMATPERFVPQYGGYCSWAMANGYTARTDPEAWAIVGDRLYLNFDQDVKQDWEVDRESLILAADENWPESKPARNRQ